MDAIPTASRAYRRKIGAADEELANHNGRASRRLASDKPRTLALGWTGHFAYAGSFTA